MATCDRCNLPDKSYNLIFKEKTCAGKCHLRWICDGCYSGITPATHKHRGIGYYRKITYQIIIPIMIIMFILITLGITIGA